MVMATVLELASVAGALFYLRFLMGLLRDGRRKFGSGSIVVHELGSAARESEPGFEVKDPQFADALKKQLIPWEARKRA